MKKLITFVCLLLFVGVFAVAQEFGSIKGTLTDKDKNPLPGASITLKGSKIAPRTAISSEEGNFRFLNLPVAADYTLKCELPGFKTIMREKLVVTFGRDVILTLVMEQATIAEEVTVIGQTPVIDTKRTQVGVNITETMIMDLPTARNPWVMMALVPGMLVDREDIGGNEGGQQSSYYGHGSSGNDNTWNIDGANITDNSALGAAPNYVNISSYEELQVNYGNNDVKSQTGGVQLNLVTKRGGNAYSGTFYLDVEDENWQLKNVPSGLASQGYKSPGIYRLYLYGANFGGPIVKDVAWFYGSWGVQDIDKRTLAQTSDKTWLVSGYANLNFQITPNTRLNGYLEYDNKRKWGRTNWGDTEQSADTKWNQIGPGYLYKGEIEQQFGNLLLNAKAIYTNGGFELIPALGKRTANGSGPYEYAVEVPVHYVSGNIDDYGTDRNQLDVNVSGNLFLEKVLGVDHEIKFGVDYVTATVTTYDYYEGNLTIHDYGPGDIEAWLLRDYVINYWFARYSAFIQDTISFGRLAINIGVRYDQEVSKVKNEHQPASPWLPQYMPDLTLSEFDPGVAWKVLSPRLSLTYDLFGNGKDVIKFSIARYGSQSGFGLADFVNPVGWTEIDLMWVDANKDGRVTPNELWGYDWSTGQYKDPNDPKYWLWYGGFDPSNPSAVTARNKFDSNYNSPLLDEISASYEKELFTDFAARLELFYKRRHQFDFNKGLFDPSLPASGSNIETASNYYLYLTDPVTGQQSYARHVWPVGTYRTNTTNAYQQYLAAQIVVKKRLSNNWMMDGSFTYSDWTYHNGGDYLDPTNTKYYDGGVVAPGSGGSGLTGIYVNSRWMLKLSGLYEFPYGINASAVFVARDGYVIPTYVITKRPGFSTTNIYGHQGSAGTFGDTRLPMCPVLNVRVEKVFHVSDTSSVTVAADAFNALNVATSLKKAGVITNKDFMQDKLIVDPTVFRFGIRFNF
jgi:hypothetical protein